MPQFVAGLGAAQLILNVSEAGLSSTGNYSTFAWSFYMNCGNGVSWNANPTSYSANIAGYGYSGTYTFDFRTTNSKLIAAATTGAVSHAANGTLGTSGSATTGNTGTSAIGGPGSVSGSFIGSNIPPQNPVSVHIGTRTTTSVQLLFVGASSGSTPSNYIVQIANNASFTSPTQYNNLSGNITMSSLAAGTNYWVRVLAQNASGNSGWVTVATSTLVDVPGAPTGITPSAVTPTSMHIAWTAPTFVGGPNGGLTGWQLDYSLVSDFSSGVTTITDGGTWGTSTDLSGLAPGNTYYIRVRAKSSAGYGANSSTLSQTTLPSTPPVVTVAPALSGKSSVVTLTPPSGVTGVDSWKIKVTDTVTAVTTEYDPITQPYTVTGMTPGRLYSYTAAAVIGAYTSPYSTPITATQPLPSTNPGAYFDGAKTDTNDTDFGWTGTADVSTSTAKGKGILGWSAAPVTTGAVVLARSTGAPADAAPQPYGATMTVLADLANTTPSFRLGMIASAPYWSAVQPSTPYNGSIFVDTYRDLRLAIEISWYTAGGALISRSTGPGLVVLGTDGFTRVSGTVVSPDTAAFATLALVNASGTGSSQIIAGDQITVDASMIMLNALQPYFDGATVDTAYAQYDWLGTANQSTSTWTPLTPTSVDPLADPDIDPVPPAPVPPSIPNEGIIEVGTWRRYWVSIPADQVASFLTEVPTIALATSSVSERQVRIRVYENPLGQTPDVFDSSSWVSEQIISYIPPNTEMLIDGVAERVWASVNGGASTSADHLLYGTGGVPATWPVLSCGIGYLMSFDTPLDSPSNNLTIDLSLTRRM